MSYSVSRVQWEEAAPLLKNVREKVFICEWRIPKHIEFDRKDRLAHHMLVCDDQTQEPIATGRILPSGEISRVAVLMEFRQKQIDLFVLKGLLSIAKELDLDEVFIHSMLDSVAYFIRHNFKAVGAVFMEAGMPRQRMVCSIENTNVVDWHLTHYH
jgi:predicted GNAT family N-acyltransferase